MSLIIKQDKNGVKPLLQTGELGYDNYPAGGDSGRVYVGTGSVNIPLAKKAEMSAVDEKVDVHIVRVDNPHGVTKAQVGLSNVDNTSDLNKPISTATQIALNKTAYSVETIEELINVPVEFNTVIVKDINRGGTFVSKTAVDINPNTGSLYVVNGGTVFAKLGGGFWVRQYSGTVNIKWFGAKGDGITDDTNAIQTAIDYAKVNGLKLIAPTGVYITGAISVSNNTSSWSIHGEGVDATMFIHKDGNGTMFAGNNNAYGFTMSDFSIDCKYSLYNHASANHGISIADTNNVRLIRINIRDYKNSAILFFSSTATFANNCVAIDCESDGLNNSNNGMLCADIYRSGFINCRALNIGKLGSPCYALQLKNGCQECFITNSLATNAVIGIALGNYDLLYEGKMNIISNCRVYGCDIGVAFGNTKENIVNGISIDMNNAGQNAIDFNLNSVGCSVVNATITNVLPTKAAARFRNGDVFNIVDIINIDNSSGIAGTGTVIFDSGSLNNVATISGISNPSTVSDSTLLCSDYSTGGKNIFEYKPLPNKQVAYIFSDSISIRHSKITRILLNPEGGANDDLSIISNGVDSQIITLSQRTNAPDITVKHGVGNIKLNGSVDFAFTFASQTLTLVYISLLNSWCEVSRGTAV